MTTGGLLEDTRSSRSSIHLFIYLFILRPACPSPVSAHGGQHRSCDEARPLRTMAAAARTSLCAVKPVRDAFPKRRCQGTAAGADPATPATRPRFPPPARLGPPPPLRLPSRQLPRRRAGRGAPHQPGWEEEEEEGGGDNDDDGARGDAAERAGGRRSAGWRGSTEPLSPPLPPAGLGRRLQLRAAALLSPRCLRAAASPLLAQRSGRLAPGRGRPPPAPPGRRREAAGARWRPTWITASARR